MPRKASSLSPRFTPGSNLSAHLEILPGDLGQVVGTPRKDWGGSSWQNQPLQGLTVAGSEYPAAVALRWMDGWMGLETHVGLHSPLLPFPHLKTIMES